MTDRTIIFAGPTIGAEEVRAILPDAAVLPPVAQGDVYRAARLRPRAIGIIDGVFDRVPAVWHKEILSALSDGIAVYGSASMGALRAAELDAFGMVGVGGIYAAYRDGAIEDDDEVAIAHGTADAGYRELSDAMVNIRATLEAAEGAGIISGATARQLEAAAKALFYPQRTYGAAIDAARLRGCDGAELERFRAWLPTGRVNAKRRDALAMLESMKSPVEAGRPGFRFEHTVFFAELAAAVQWDESDIPSFPGHHGVLDELRLRPAAWREAVRGATLRVVAERDARARGLDVSDETLVDATVKYRRTRELHDPDALLSWMEANDLTPRSFIALMEAEARVEWLIRATRDEALGLLVDELRASGTFTGLCRRAQEKAAWLEAQGLGLVSLEDLGMSERDLLAWHFGRVGEEVPTDLSAYAQATGFDEVEAFRRAVTRDYLFARRDPPDA
jgi:hypothetical protein